jgi:L-cysteate sulfo-lyase
MRPAKTLLGSWPTPLEPSPRLAVALGLAPDDLWVKRDDLVGLGAGGNKVRKLEWTCAEAERRGADVLVTSGAAQSNHARLTAAAGARLGLDVVLVLGGTADAGESGGNLALDALLGATIEWSGSFDEDVLAGAVDEVAAGLERRGRRPYVVPYGGSSPLSTHAYLECAEELLAQGPAPDHVAVAVGSGGTMAGLVRGLGAAQVLGVDCGAVRDPRAAVASLLAEHAADVAPRARRLRLDQVGDGYANLQPEVLEACRTAARTEGIVLDPVYTGRALAGLAAAVRDGEVVPGQRVVLMHTGGLPGLFGHPQMLAALHDGDR